MRLNDFIQSIDVDTPTEIIFYKTREELKDKMTHIKTTCEMWLLLNGAKLESVIATDKCFMLILSKNGKVYGIDWTDGFGLTLEEYLPPEPLVY